MNKILITFALALVFLPTHAELNDQGLISIISIIDKAIESTKSTAANPSENNNPPKTAEELAKELSSSTIVNMARTLGNLSFSRLQCGETSVLGEFTKRVQSAPELYQNAMRSAFQEGFDKSKASTKLLSKDECKRLTESRQIKATQAEAKVDAPKKAQQPKQAQKQKPAEDPSLKYKRIAYITGQFAYKKKYCGDKKVINRDFNEVIKPMPKDMQDIAKKSYWKGYKQGKRMNKNLTADHC